MAGLPAAGEEDGFMALLIGTATVSVASADKKSNQKASTTTSSGTSTSTTTSTATSITTSTTTSTRLIALAGNPNCGKSALFNKLTGLYVNVSNFPGTTVDITKGSWLGADLIDTPGVYGLGSYSDEERIARDSLLQADVVINVVNATTLERDLFLTLQLVDMGVPMVIALNMMDEAEHLGLKLDVSMLAQLTGVPVVPVVAITGRGLDELAHAVSNPKIGIPGTQAIKAVQEERRRLAADQAARKTASAAAAVKAAATVPPLASEPPLDPSRISQGALLLLAEGDEEIARRLGISPGEHRELIYTQRRRRADRIAAGVIKGGGEFKLGQILGEWTARPVVGIPILVAVLWGLYWFIGLVVAQTVVEFTEGVLFSEYYEPLVRQFAAAFIAPENFIYKVMAGEFGLLTMTPTYLFGLLLPLVAGFYLALSLMEDSGYLPRVALLTDKILNRLGLNGRAVIPMILGLGCVTMATFTTRVLASRRERTIALALLGIAIPCSAQLGVIAVLVTPLGIAALAFYIAVILVVYGLIGITLNRVLPGRSSDLLLDLPPLRLPQPANILKKTASRVAAFLSEAAPIFAAGVLLVAILQETGILQMIQRAAGPLTAGWLQLPPESAQAFIMGLVRRDFGTAGLYSLAMTSHQKLVASITITLFVPCIASMLVLFKERGVRDAAAIFVGSILVALGTGGLVSRLIYLIGWNLP